MFLKQNRDDACLVFSGMSFHISVARYEKHPCPLPDFFLGNFKSVAVLRRACEELYEFVVKRLK